MGRRRLAREIALQALYLLDVSSLPSSEAAALSAIRRGSPQKSQPGDDAAAFAKEIVLGTRGKLAEIDSAIESAARNWRLERMAAVDRNILRLAAYELMFSSATPPKAVIDEAIEITRAFSTEESTKFVNGVLDAIARSVKAHDSQDSHS